MNPLLYVLPVFIGFMLAEHIITARQGRSAYSFRETVGNLYCAIGQFFIELFLKLPLLALYLFLGRYSLEMKLTGWAKWLALFVVIDFLFWLSHLIAHKIPWMWAIHGVHHQAEHYNFSVGLRMPWWHKFTAFWIYIPPALLGFSAQDYILVATLQASAQIWTHTTLFKNRIPVFEWIFVTPSHHRVHHGKNRIYIDKNFGGILSVWDYIFGTYHPETEPVKFGIPKHKPRVNPLSTNFVQFIPEIMPALPKHKSLPGREKLVIASFTVALITGVAWTFLNEAGLTLPQRAVALVSVLCSMIAVGLWMDHREDWFRDVKIPVTTSSRFTTLMLIVGLFLI